MARPKNTAKSTTNTKKATAVVETMAVETEEKVVDDMNVKDETVKEEVKEVVTKKNTEALKDEDEIAIVSLIPNVSYGDDKTGDTYEWETTGSVEYITFGTLKNLWRNYKGYFRNLWLRPQDERVIEHFGLGKFYEQYDYIMDAENYDRKQIKKICEIISGSPNGIKITVFNKIKDMIVNGEVSDIQVIRTLENTFNLDLISLLS